MEYAFWASAIGQIIPASQKQLSAQPPEGYTLFTLTDTDTPSCTEVWNASQNYTYTNGTVTYTPVPASVLLAHAKQQQISLLTQGLNATLSGGFTSKSTGHTYPTSDGAQRNFTAVATAFQTNTNKTSAFVLTSDAGWLTHTKTEFYGMYSDGDEWEEAQYPQLNSLIAQVEAATTIAEVQAVVWTAATY